ncbi:MAG: GGGtGRT protein [Ruminiclostridium sp.]
MDNTSKFKMIRLAGMVLSENVKSFAFLAGHESFAAT